MAELAARQGVLPVEELDALGASWPVDDDPDALDAFLAEQRALRRTAAAQRQVK
jgi:hypothetical protein